MELEEKKLIASILTSFNSPERKFVYSDEAERTQTKKYNYFTPALRMKNNAQNDFGTVSDAYLLYMASVIEWCDQETLIRLLLCYSRDNKRLDISSDAAGMGQRLHHLCGSLGLAHYRTFQVERNNTWETIACWGTEKETVEFVNRRMSKSISARDNSYYENLNTMIGKAAAAYTAGIVAEKSGCLFKAVHENAIKTIELGIRMMPPILYLDSKESRYEVLFYPAFLNRVESYQTDIDYKNFLKRKCDEVRNFLYATNVNNKTRKSNVQGIAVIVCESKSDLEAFASLCEQLPATVDCGNIDNIYLTSEGTLRMAPSLKESFLKMEKTDEGEITVRHAIPPFVVK